MRLKPTSLFGQLNARNWSLDRTISAITVQLLFLTASVKAAPHYSAERAASHWAFKPVQAPPLPDVRQVAWPANPIDRFILARLENADLAPAPQAPPETIIRRIYLDLIGLPPTPDELRSALKGTSAELIERLLASPHYGERWGRHWLDLARYAETDGFEHDLVRTHSWRYRDYVINSFNADKPYDQFIREQIAGDELWKSLPPEIRKPELLVATGFNLLGPDMADSSDQVQRRLNTLVDMTDTTALAFLGMTMGCARCHDHPFEPISQRDYYSFQAFYTPVSFERDTAVHTAEEKAAFNIALAKYNARPQVRKLAAFDGAIRTRLREASSGAKKISDKDFLRALTKEEKKQRDALMKAARRISKPELPKAMTLAYPDGEWQKTFLLNRGNYDQPRDQLSPALPGVLAKSTPSAAHQRRRDLADWLTDQHNPLTARVMVNRIWLHHFGRGLVPTPSDFGLNGQPPSHPELLDWLATEFVRTGWSIKAMHRLMLNSATYRMSAHCDNRTRGIDPQSKLFSRWEPIRLEGEVVRDSLLAISGMLNTDMGGPGDFPPIPSEMFQGAKGWNSSADESRHVRRSVYIFARRNLRFPFLEVFDAPDSNQSCSNRERSTTAPQSLTLLNADEVLTASTLTAQRVKVAGKDVEEQIQRTFRIILGRKPNSNELAASQAFLVEAPLSELCRALFNLNDFVYLN